jgi:hypothetical protein
VNTDAFLSRVALLGLLIAGACVGADGPGADAEDRARASEGVRSPAEERDHLWTATSSGGTEVALAWAASEARVGAVRLELSIARGPASRIVSVDLVSPTMPMHGVVRVPVGRSDDGRWVAELDIPMEGRWAVFVNLDDDGADTAEFRFDVPPPGGSLDSDLQVRVARVSGHPAG